jgi:Na+/H+ antiporter NhaA
VLLAATVAALVWSNVDRGHYDSLWATRLSIELGHHGVALDLRGWINNGLMTFFFFVVGLEARREFDVGDLRERRRVTLPLVAALGGIAVAVALYLAINAGRPSAHGWGVAMSTDTAFALGVLALVGPRFPDRLRAFMVTVVVVDDVVSLLVIAVAYTSNLDLRELGVAAVFSSLILGVRAIGVQHALVYLVLGAATWVALLRSGIDPIVIGLAMGLLTYAYPAARSDLERASDLFRRFREQPTPQLARTARSGLQSAISPNERLQQLFLPWTSYAIVPLFALANAGVSVGAHSLGRAFTSPIALGIVIGYVAGKPIGLAGTTWLVSRLSRGRLRPPVGWGAVVGGGMVAGIGFTVALLIASLAFTGSDLEAAKVGILTTAFLASAGSWLFFRVITLLPLDVRARALLGTTESLVDLATPVDPERDHVRGPDAPRVTLVEYGDFECPYCGQAEPVVRELLGSVGDVRYVWRHLPLNDVHPNAQQAAEAAEAAAKQGAFWEMHDTLLTHQDALTARDLVGYAGDLGLDVDQFTEDLRRRSGAPRIADDVDSADLSGVAGTPTFFINGRRHWGAYDIDTLSRAVREAGARALFAPRQ